EPGLLVSVRRAAGPGSLQPVAGCPVDSGSPGSAAVLDSARHAQGDGTGLFHLGERHGGPRALGSARLAWDNRGCRRLGAMAPVPAEDFLSAAGRAALAAERGHFRRFRTVDFRRSLPGLRPALFPLPVGWGMAGLAWLAPQAVPGESAR